MNILAGFNVGLCLKCDIYIKTVYVPFPFKNNFTLSLLLILAITYKCEISTLIDTTTLLMSYLNMMLKHYL